MALEVCFKNQNVGVHDMDDCFMSCSHEFGAIVTNFSGYLLPTGIKSNSHRHQHYHHDNNDNNGQGAGSHFLYLRCDHSVAAIVGSKFLALAKRRSRRPKQDPLDPMVVLRHARLFDGHKSLFLRRRSYSHYHV